MPTDNPSPPPAEDFDPEQTVFFQRRKRQVNLLPLAVVCVLVLGSGALIVWAVSDPGGGKKVEEITKAPVDDAYAGRPILSTDQARQMENPVVATPPPAAPAPAADGGAFDRDKPVRAAEPVAAATTPADDGSAPPAIDADAPLNFDVNDPGNAHMREEVLKRIDLMPGVSAASKDKLYVSVDHARRMGRVLTVPFDKGGTALRPGDADRLKAQLDKPEVRALLDDPTVVFVVLGYADQKGSDKLNADISLARAKSVMDTLRDRFNFQNVMHSVAMGGSTLFSAQEADKNRVVELWAVLP